MTLRLCVSSTERGEGSEAQIHWEGPTGCQVLSYPPSPHPHGGDPAWSQQGKAGDSDAGKGEETASGGTGGPGPQRARSAPHPGGEGSPLPRPGQGPWTHTVQAHGTLLTGVQRATRLMILVS